MIKKAFFIGLMSLMAGTVCAQNNSEREDYELPKLHVSAFYQVSDFDFMKESGLYGLGLYATSIGQWGKFHIGANVNFGINAGLVDDWGVDIEFGPSVRYDIGKRVYLNMPVNVNCYCMFPEGSSETETSWGLIVSPTIHGWLTKRFGIFAGPQVSKGFSEGSETSFGFIAGVSCVF